MDPYMDDLQAAIARAEAAEKALVDLNDMIDTRIARELKRRAVFTSIIISLIGFLWLGGSSIWYWAFDPKPEPVARSCRGGNGGDLALEAGAPGNGCTSDEDGVPGKIVLGGKIAREIDIGRADGLTVIHGDVVFDGSVRITNQRQLIDFRSGAGGANVGSGNGGALQLLGGTGGGVKRIESK
jgi:hypothetical protein